MTYFGMTISSAKNLTHVLTPDLYLAAMQVDAKRKASR
jgi:hypothetical protein